MSPPYVTDAVPRQHDALATRKCRQGYCFSCERSRRSQSLRQYYCYISRLLWCKYFSAYNWAAYFRRPCGMIDCCEQEEQACTCRPWVQFWSRCCASSGLHSVRAFWFRDQLQEVDGGSRRFRVAGRDLRDPPPQSGDEGRGCPCNIPFIMHASASVTLHVLDSGRIPACTCFAGLRFFFCVQHVGGYLMACASGGHCNVQHDGRRRLSACAGSQVKQYALRLAWCCRFSQLRA